MPGMNGTGPQGCGPMTGRGLGGCGTDEVVQNAPAEHQVAVKNIGGGFCRCGQFLRRGFSGGFVSGRGRSRNGSRGN